MKSVSVKQLQNDLNHYLDEVRSGEKELAAYHAQMVAEGKMTLPKIEPTPEFWEEFFKEPRPNIPLNEILQLINEDRDED